MSGSYSLSTAVSHLETVLEVMGQGRVGVASDETRASLRERFRKLLRLFKRFKAEHDFEQQTWLMLVASHHQASPLPDWGPANFGAGPASQPGNIFTRKAHPAGGELLTGTWADSYSPARLYTGRLDDLPAPAPVFAKAQVAKLAVAIQVGIDGMTAVCAAVMDLWTRRHDILKSDAAIKPPQHGRHALERLFLALMRFALGFFGSHKVDARNNP
jgi:hypothetical protein